jgi:hypothetical protein
MGHFTLKPDSRVLWRAEIPAIGAMIHHRKRTSRKARKLMGRQKNDAWIGPDETGPASGGFWDVTTVRFVTLGGLLQKLASGPSLNDSTGGLGKPA